MGIDLKFQDLNNKIWEDDDSTAPNSLIEEVDCNVLDGHKSKRTVQSINSVAFSNSTNIQIGDRVIYNGPVSIAQEISNVNKELNVGATKSHRKGFKWLNCKCAIIFTAIILALLAALGAILYVLNPKNTTKNNDFRIVSRDEWGALPAEEEVKLNLPVKKVIVAHTVMRNCYTLECCKNILKQIQNYHMFLNWGDIGYNFVICNDGNAYEGAGWDLRGAHTYGVNSKSIGIAFNGDFRNEVPNKNQVAAFFALVQKGVELGKLTSDYNIFGARQYIQSESPGEALYQMIQTWDHWSDET